MDGTELDKSLAYPTPIITQPLLSPDIPQDLALQDPSTLVEPPPSLRSHDPLHLTPQETPHLDVNEHAPKEKPGFDAPREPAGGGSVHGIEPAEVG